MHIYNQSGVGVKESNKNGAIYTKKISKLGPAFTGTLLCTPKTQHFPNAPSLL